MENNILYNERWTKFKGLLVNNVITNNEISGSTYFLLTEKTLNYRNFIFSDFKRDVPFMVIHEYEPEKYRLVMVVLHETNYYHLGDYIPKSIDKELIDNIKNGIGIIKIPDDKLPNYKYIMATNFTRLICLNGTPNIIYNNGLSFDELKDRNVEVFFNQIKKEFFIQQNNEILWQ